MAYTESQEKELIAYCKQLPEKARRHFLAMEYKRLGRGSQSYLAKVFGCSRWTITKGVEELAGDKAIDYSRQRKMGGGRKKKWLIPEVVSRLLSLIEAQTAGSPVDAGVKWTHLKPREIASLYSEQYGRSISNGTVKRILKAEGYRNRRPSKQLATGQSPYREEQFKILVHLVGLFALMEHNPGLSVDTKKKERLGNLDRGGRVLCKEAPEVFDHDYSYLAQGKVIPHGIYDLRQNKGFVTIGNSHETAEFIVDNLRWWWSEHGMHQYPNANYILLLCDSGGANGYRHYAFKKHLLDLAKEIQVRIVVCHYPPYCSKWNPIEHRLFAQIHHAISGNLFVNYQQVKELFEKTSTKTGLTVVVRLSLLEYHIGLKIGEDQIQVDRILKHPDLPQFNYTILPN